MSAPIPKPRYPPVEKKKPLPLPRKISLNLVVETTRKISRKFSVSSENSEKNEEDTLETLTENPEIFEKIHFNSPLDSHNCENSIVFPQNSDIKFTFHSNDNKQRIYENVNPLQFPDIVDNNCNLSRISDSSETMNVKISSEKSEIHKYENVVLKSEINDNYESPKNNSLVNYEPIFPVKKTNIENYEKISNYTSNQSVAHNTENYEKITEFSNYPTINNESNSTLNVLLPKVSEEEKNNHSEASSIVSESENVNPPVPKPRKFSSNTAETKIFDYENFVPKSQKMSNFFIPLDAYNVSSKRNSNEQLRKSYSPTKIDFTSNFPSLKKKDEILNQDIPSSSKKYEENEKVDEILEPVIKIEESSVNMHLSSILSSIKPPVNDVLIDNQKSHEEKSKSWSFYDPVTLNCLKYQTPIEQNTEVDSNARHDTKKLNVYYENYLESFRKSNRNTTKSVLFEFDPLTNEFLDESCYGNEFVFDFDCFGDIQPPPPPKRFDSLLPNADLDSSQIDISNEGSSEPTEPVEVAEPSEPSTSSELPLKRTGNSWFNKQLKQLNYYFQSRGSSAPQLKKPSPILTATFEFRANLFKISNPVPSSNSSLTAVATPEVVGFRAAVLKAGNGASLKLFVDKNCYYLKESFLLENFISIQVGDSREFPSNHKYYCFDIIEIQTSKNPKKQHFGCHSQQEVQQWMRKFTSALAGTAFEDFGGIFKMSWAYLKESISGSWAGFWIILTTRKLHYFKNNQLVTLDLRKIRLVKLQEDFESKIFHLFLDFQEGFLYLQFWNFAETKMWLMLIESESFKSMKRLNDQQLTKENVPVIVENCVNFIYLNGSMSEGIYRKNGASLKIQEIFTRFSAPVVNAWTIVLTADYCSEHDVASVLKQFFRSLPEPVFDKETRDNLLCISHSVKTSEEKITSYKAVFEKFPTVLFNTLKKILRHLFFISTQVEKNRMTVENLGAIWAQNLFHADGWSSDESSLTTELIKFCPQIFPMSAKEQQKEHIMLQVLMKTQQKGMNLLQPSGDLKIWVHLKDKLGQVVNVTISPTKLAGDICLELSERMRRPAHELQLQESIVGGALLRPIHYTERILPIILNWCYMTECDRKHNCLLLDVLSKYEDFVCTDAQETVNSISTLIKFADQKSKYFRTHFLQVRDNHCAIFKDQKINQRLYDFKINEISWYFGCDPKRNQMQTKWSLTFILKNLPPKRDKNSPYFGFVLGSNDLELRKFLVRYLIYTSWKTGLQLPLVKF